MMVCDATVTHRRFFPVRYRFTYRVFALLMDIDALDDDASALRLFSHNRFNLLSFHDVDHGPRDGTSLRPWLEQRLREHAGIELDRGRIRVLCFPRVLGYGFNPITLWYCDNSDGALVAVLCEVHNTFGESHSYVLHDAGRALSLPVRSDKSKCFHVSPLMDMNAEYAFRISPPARRVGYAIRQTQDRRHLLSAGFGGELHRVSDAGLLRRALSIPFLGFKVMLAIHWQALLIWLRGAPFHRKPIPPATTTS